MDFFISLTPFLAAIFDHWGGQHSAGKSEYWRSHFVVTRKCGCGRRKSALGEATAAYSPQHDRGPERGRSGSKVRSKSQAVSPIRVSTPHSLRWSMQTLGLQLITRNTSLCQSIRSSLESIFLPNSAPRPLHQISFCLNQLL